MITTDGNLEGEMNNRLSTVITLELITGQFSPRKILLIKQKGEYTNTNVCMRVLSPKKKTET